MTKSNNSTTEPRDRLSELPNSIIFHIFWLLPMTDVVRTTILSKQWKNLWTTAPCLNFDDSMVRGTGIDFAGKNNADRLRNFVIRALLFRRGIKILKFKIRFSNSWVDNWVEEKLLCNDIDLWLRFAMENGVEELYIHLGFLDSPSTYRYSKQTCKKELYWLPQNLYSCSSIKLLSLEACNLRINAGNVQWNQLQSLTMLHCYFDERLANQVFCGSPQLEVFISSFPEMDENLSIRSSSLKMLSIDKYLKYDEEEIPSRYTHLKIWSPNLETLEILGVPYSKCSLMNVKSLTHANLGFDAGDIFEFCYWDLYLEETSMQIFPTIQHVEKLTLSDWCIKVLVATKKKHLLSPLSNVKFLKINEIHAQYEEIVDLLEIFPKLEILVLKQNYYKIPEKHDKSLLKIETNLPNSFLLQLRIVEVRLIGGENSSMFPFIDIVLKCARNLEKIVIQAPRIELYVKHQ